jgi:protein-disulfide isomerase
MNKEKLGKMLKENPELIHEAIKADPAEFMMVLQEAARDAKGAMEDKKREAEKKAFEESFKNPLKPEIRDDESIRGTKGAPIVLVEYSDFECPFCSRGFNTVTQVMEKYEGKVQFIYKHLPLSFHPAAMIAAQYYEAIRLQSEEKAFKFHDAIFANQRKLKNGKKFLEAEAKKLGVNMSKLKKDVDSDKVKKRIEADMAEAAKFGIQGTPGFVLNGIPIKGAYPLSHFDKIIGELKERKLINL